MIGALMAVALYTVKPGDTLWGIAGNAWPVVCADNRIPDCNLIYPGQELRLSVGNASVTASARPSEPRSDPPASVSGGTLGCAGLQALWDDAGGAQWASFTAAEIAMAESGGNQYATGPVGERGYWQINPDHGYLSTYDAYGNARAAIIISDDGSNWSAWTTYTSGAYIGRCLYVDCDPTSSHYRDKRSVSRDDYR